MLNREYFDRGTFLLRSIFFLVLGASLCFYVEQSLRWPLLVDSPVMHYVNFLMDHGMAPYRDITDNNMPGSYLMERWAMEVFGRTDQAWRIYDYFLLAVQTLACYVIARPYDRWAGFYAGGMFALLHASEGPNFAVEREQVMTALIIVSTAFLFTALRKRTPRLCFAFGLCAAMACSIKPTVLLFLLFAVPIMSLVLRRRQENGKRYIYWCLAGALLASLVNLMFLLHYGVWRDFFFVLLKITPAYASLRRPEFTGLLGSLIPKNLLVLIPFGVAIILLRRGWNWERSVLLMGAGVGAISFFVQHKGFLHHRYLFVMFVLLLLGIEMFSALKVHGVVRAIAASAVLLNLCVGIPHYLQTFRKVATRSELTEALEQDLKHFGPNKLQHNVMCFDLVFGCLNSLYHLEVTESNGFTGDLLLFSPTPGLARDYYRQKFTVLEAQHPSDVFVVTNQWFGDRNTFTKVDTWPEFSEALRRSYKLVKEREFPLEGYPPGASPGREEPPAYRIYVRRGSEIDEPHIPSAVENRSSR